MSGTQFKLKIDRGATWRMGVVPAHQSGGVETPVDLTGATFRFVVKHDFNHEIRVFPVTVEAGRVYMVLTDVDTETFSADRRYYYNLDMAYPSGDIRRILEGAMYFNE